MHLFKFTLASLAPRLGMLLKPRALLFSSARHFTPVRESTARAKHRAHSRPSSSASASDGQRAFNLQVQLSPENPCVPSAAGSHYEEPPEGPRDTRAVSLRELCWTRLRRAGPHSVVAQALHKRSRGRVSSHLSALLAPDVSVLYEEPVLEHCPPTAESHQTPLAKRGPDCLHNLERFQCARPSRCWTACPPSAQRGAHMITHAIWSATSARLPSRSASYS
jgi:hypothetical protein